LGSVSIIREPDFDGGELMNTTCLLAVATHHRIAITLAPSICALAARAAFPADELADLFVTPWPVQTDPMALRRTGFAGRQSR